MKHYTKRTVSAAAWCGKCQRETQHRVNDGRRGPCLECISRLEDLHSARMKSPAPVPAIQKGLPF